MKLYSAQPNSNISLSSEPEMANALRAAVLKYGITYAVETGTYHGLGSTRHIIRAMEGIPGRQLITVENDTVSHAIASENLADYPWVKPLHGLSIAKATALKWIERDPVLKDHTVEPDILIDNVDDPLKFYRNEVEGMLTKQAATGVPLQENLMIKALNNAKGVPLILLDSCGGIGWAEFNEVLSVMGTREFVLALDDCQHIKHYRSKQYIENSLGNEPLDWQILAKDTIGGRWLVAHHNGLPVVTKPMPVDFEEEVHTERRRPSRKPKA